MDYFKHYANASDSKSLNIIFDKFGHRGIAFWWMLVELCSEHWDGQSEPEFEFHSRTVVTKLKSSSRSVTPWLELCSDLGMLAFAHNSTKFSLKFPKLMKVKTSRNVIKSNKKQLTVYKEENRIEENRIEFLEETVVTPSVKKNSKTREEKAKAKEIKQAYVKSYSEKYSVTPVFAAMEHKLVYTLLSKVGFDESLWLASKYPFFNDPWHIGRKHPFASLVSDISKIRIELRDPNRMLDANRAKKQLSEVGDKIDFKQKRAEYQKRIDDEQLKAVGHDS